MLLPLLAGAQRPIRVFSPDVYQVIVPLRVGRVGDGRNSYGGGRVDHELQRAHVVLAGEAERFPLLGAKGDSDEDVGDGVALDEDCNKRMKQGALLEMASDWVAAMLTLKHESIEVVWASRSPTHKHTP